MMRRSDANSPGLVMVVDDDHDTLKILVMTLQRAGYDVLEARSGPEALRLLDTSAPDVVLLDLMMPDMDGYEVFRSIKRRMSWPPPVIVFTAKATVHDKVRGMEAGAFRYLTKPAKKDELLAAVKAAVEEKRRRRERPPDDQWA